MRIETNARCSECEAFPVTVAVVGEDVPHEPGTAAICAGCATQALLELEEVKCGAAS